MLTRIEWEKERNKRFPRFSCLSLLLHLHPRLPLAFLSACLLSFSHTSLSFIGFSFPFLTTSLSLLPPPSHFLVSTFYYQFVLLPPTSFFFHLHCFPSSQPFILPTQHTVRTLGPNCVQNLIPSFCLCSPPSSFLLISFHPRQFLLFASKNVGVISVGCVCSICAFEFPWVFCKRGIHLCSPGSEFAERVVAAQPHQYYDEGFHGTGNLGSHWGEYWHPL